MPTTELRKKDPRRLLLKLTDAKTGKIDISLFFKSIPTLYMESSDFEHPQYFSFADYNHNVTASFEKPNLVDNTTNKGYSRTAIELKFNSLNDTARKRENKYNPEKRRTAKYNIHDFNMPKFINGVAGLKLLEIMRKHNVPSPHTPLMIGSHPGSDINAIQLYQQGMTNNLPRLDRQITAVSIYPHEDIDANKAFCYKVPHENRHNVEFHPKSFADFIDSFEIGQGIPKEKHDFAYVDCTTWSD